MGMYHKNRLVGPKTKKRIKKETSHGMRRAVKRSCNDESRSGWFDKKDLKNTTELIINREQLKISATMVREYMVHDEREKWMECVNPKLHKMYDRLRSELMNVEFYKNMK